MNQKEIIALVGCITIIGFILLATLFMYVFKKNSECVQNPFLYSVKDTNLTCSCYDDKVSFTFDRKGLKKDCNSYACKLDEITFINKT